jgi:hypothetical protein
MNVLAGADFFTVEVLTWRGLVTYYVLFFIHLETRRVSVAGITRRPDQEWMEQIARSATQETWGYLHPCRYVLHDRDTKFCASFRSVLAAGGVKTIPLPARSPNLNAFAERWVVDILGTSVEIMSRRVLLFWLFALPMAWCGRDGYRTQPAQLNNGHPLRPERRLSADKPSDAPPRPFSTSESRSAGDRDSAVNAPNWATRRTRRRLAVN